MSISAALRDAEPFLSPSEEDDLDGGATATSFALNRTYVDGGTFQWAYELLRNVEQLFDRMVAAGEDTSKVGMWFDHVQIEVLNTEGDVIAKPLLRRVWNIGTPMDPETELLRYYTRLNLGGGTKRWSPVNLNAPYGMGSRAALLGWTDTMFVTSVPGKGSFGITLRGVTDENGNITYSQTRPVLYDEDGGFTVSLSPMVKLAHEDDDVYYLRSHGGTSIALTEDLLDEQVREHGGFTQIMLGRGDYTKDVFVDTTPAKKETSAGIIPAISDRFRMGKFPVVAETIFEPKEGHKGVAREWTLSDGTKVRGNRRALKKFSDWTDRAERLKDVPVDGYGTKVTPYLLPEDYWHTGSYTKEERDAEAAKDPKAVFEYRSDGTYGKLNVKDIDTMHPFKGQGQVVVAFNSELYAVKEPGLRGRASILSAWGIPQERVARSVLLVITPPVLDSIESEDWGITQNGARSNITAKNGESLPFNSWQAEFIEYFPKEIGDRLAVRPPSTSKLIAEEDIAKMEQRVFGESTSTPKTPARIVIDEKGKVDGEPTDGTIATSQGHGKGKGNGGGPSSGPSQTAVEKTGGGFKTARRRPKRPTPPQPEFLTGQQWRDAGYDADLFCVVSEAGQMFTIELNGAHRVMERQVKYFWDDTVHGHWSDAKRAKTRAKILVAAGGKSTPGADEKAKLAAIEEIEYVYRFDALATFIGAQSGYLNADGSVDTVGFMKLFRDEEGDPTKTMTVSLAAIHPQEEAIKSRLNSLAGRSSI
jgi:hypothetical protein